MHKLIAAIISSHWRKIIVAKATVVTHVVYFAAAFTENHHVYAMAAGPLALLTFFAIFGNNGGEA